MAMPAASAERSAGRKRRRPPKPCSPAPVATAWIAAEVAPFDVFLCAALNCPGHIHERKTICSGLLGLFGPYALTDDIELQVGQIAVSVVSTDPSREAEFLPTSFIDFLIGCRVHYNDVYLEPEDGNLPKPSIPVIQHSDSKRNDATSLDKLLERIKEAGGLELGFLNTDLSISFQARPRQPQRKRLEFLEIDVGRAVVVDRVLTDRSQLIVDPAEVGALKAGDTIEQEEIEEETIERRIAKEAIIVPDGGFGSDQEDLFVERRSHIADPDSPSREA